MFDTFLERLMKIIKSRLFPVFIIYICLFSILVHRIFVLQIVEGETIEKQSEKRFEKTRDIKSTRGNIYDCNGVLLAYNEPSYSITIVNNGELKSNDEKNAMIYHLIQIIENNKGKLAYEFGLKMDKEGNIQFTEEGTSLLRFKKDVYSLTSIKKLNEKQISSTAEEVFHYLRYSNDKDSPKFLIGDQYSKKDALKIMSIRYALFMNRLNQSVPATVATNVNDEIIAAINENSPDLPGVEIFRETHRVYADSEYFAHILGYTGIVSAENLDELEENGKKDVYNLTDQIGKTGLEKSLEDDLKGSKGTETLIIDKNTRVVDVKNHKDPVAGNDIYLTIDSKLQKASYQIIEKKLAGILLSKINNGWDVGTKSDKRIPIYEVYFALIDNNIIDITNLNDKKATDLEKRVYQKFKNKESAVFRQLKSLLAYNSKTNAAQTTEEIKEYLSYIYSMLINQNILNAKLIDEKDEMLLKYKSEKINLSEFLQYAIGNNWIDLSKLSIGENYYSTKELYEKLVSFLFQLLEKDIDFNKEIYHSLISSYQLTGKEVCLLLLEQGVLEYDETEVANLEGGKVSAYSYLTKKIQELKITPAQLALEPCSGAVVIVDPNNGDVLACVSYPGYDNNKFANSVDSAYFAKLGADKSKPTWNRATRQRSAPGSTFKMVSSVAALEEGVVGPTETVKDLTSFEKIGLPYPRCWSLYSSHGNVDIPHAIEVSCNYFYYEMGYRLSLDQNGQYNSNIGLKKLQKYATMFGLGDKSGIEIWEEEPHIATEDSVRSAIGQSNNDFTPIEIARYISTVANSGTCFNLTLLDKIKDVSGKVILNNKASVRNQIKINSTTWSLVHQGMNLVVNGPKGPVRNLFKDFKIEVAGKTGTAQESTLKPNHALFVSYAPFDKPEISVVTVIPNGYASSNAAEVTRDVYRYYYEDKDKEKILNEEVKTPESNSSTFSD